eukprot:2480837-Pleurochrysis_carterae.AAC.2
MVMSVASSELRSLQSHVGEERWRAAPGGEIEAGQCKASGCERLTAQSVPVVRDGARRRVVFERGERKALSGKWRDSARRRAARGGQRKAPLL